MRSGRPAGGRGIVRPVIRRIDDSGAVRAAPYRCHEAPCLGCQHQGANTVVDPVSMAEHPLSHLEPTVPDADRETPRPPVLPICGIDWINVAGVRVSAVNLDDAVACVEDAVARGQRSYVCVRDVHGIVRCQQDAPLRAIHNRAFLVTPDGMPLVWALKCAGRHGTGRVYGPDLMLALFQSGCRTGRRHFLYGSTSETLDRLQARLLGRFPDANIVGTLSPPFRALSYDEQADVAAHINASGADIVWVGLSTPKQEYWMAQMRSRLQAPMLIGVGAAFDFHAGVKRQAPRFIQRSGFEWAFRLACEPRRLGRRYAVAIPRFIGLATAQLLGLRKFPIPDAPCADGPITNGTRATTLDIPRRRNRSPNHDRG